MGTSRWLRASGRTVCSLRYTIILIYVIYMSVHISCFYTHRLPRHSYYVLYYANNPYTTPYLTLSLYIYPYIYPYALQVMRDLGEIPDEKPKWIILDGDLDANWVSTRLCALALVDTYVYYICISIGDMYMTCVYICECCILVVLQYSSVYLYVYTICVYTCIYCMYVRPYIPHNSDPSYPSLPPD